MTGPILLIAANLVRQLRWTLLILLGLMALVVALISYDSDSPAEKVEFLIHLQSFYAVVVGVFTASSAIFNERKSRRILTVLAKGIERGEYVAGLLAGASFVSLVYCLSLGLCAGWLAYGSLLPVAPICRIVLLLLVASILASAVSLFFSTLLHPLFTAAATGLFFGLSLVAPRLLGRWSALLFPAAELAHDISAFSMNSDWRPSWIFSASALLQALLFWQAAVWVFTRRDITIAPE